MTQINQTEITQANAIPFPEVLKLVGIEQDKRGAFCCPFHPDSKPSAVVTHSNKGCCLVCKRNGRNLVFSNIDLIQHLHGVGFLDAVRFLVGEVESLEQRQVPRTHTQTQRNQINIKTSANSRHEFEYLRGRGLSFERTETLPGLRFALINNKISIRHNYYQDINKIAYLFDFCEPYELDFEPFTILKPTEAKDRATDVKAKNIGTSSPKVIWGRKGTPEIYICEGIEDALSLVQSGRNAISLNSVANVAKCVNMLNKFPEVFARYKIITATDNDEAGEQCRRDIVEGLDSVYNVQDYEALREAGRRFGVKDVNEFWLYKIGKR